VTDLVYKTFYEAQTRHGHLPDYIDIKQAELSVNNSMSNPFLSVYVAEYGKRLVGTATMKLYDEVAGVYNVAVDPSCQGKNIGKLLMAEIEDKCTEVHSIRLSQDAYNTSAFAFYSSLNYNVVDTIAVMKGEVNVNPPPMNGKHFRPMTLEDIPKCNELYKSVHGFSRLTEINLIVKHCSTSVVPHVICLNNQIISYTTGNLGGHTICSSMEDFLIFLAKSNQIHKHPMSKFNILPRLNPGLLQACLNQGMKIAKTCNLMVKGAHRPPKEGYIYIPHIY